MKVKVSSSSTNYPYFEIKSANSIADIQGGTMPTIVTVGASETAEWHAATFSGKFLILKTMCPWTPIPDEIRIHELKVVAEPLQ